MSPFLAAAAATILILRSGERIELLAPPQVEGGRVTFRAVSGALFSVAEEEVRELAADPKRESARQVESADRIPLKVTGAERERLIAQLEQNHSGPPTPPRQLETPKAAPSPTPSDQEEEWRWRNRARDRQEAIRRAAEELTLLRDEAERLQSKITGLLALGYKPSQFTYDSTRLHYTLEQIPRAELEVTRAQRAYDDLREEARRRGILPGWLR